MNLSKYIGETTLYDKKEILEERRPKSWLKSVSAFANGEGGKLFFGISNNNELVGLKNYASDSEKISEIIKVKLDPIPNIKLEIITEDNKNFIILTVFPSDETPCYLVENGSRVAYIRVGNESIPADSIHLKNLVLKGINKTFDTLSTTIPKDRASFSKLKAEYYQRTNSEINDNDFLSFGLIDDKNYLTNAGALFADERLVYQSKIFCTRWNGLDKVNGLIEAIDDKEFEGGLLYLLHSGEDFIKTNSKKMWKKGKQYRIEYPDYPERAIQEAIVNALIHRNYSEVGSEVHIDMYDDRLEIYSPGGMYDGSFIQEQDPYNIASKRRNPIIADLFSRMNLMERRGSGLKKIIEEYKLQEHYKEELKPEFRSTHSSFFIVLKNINYNNGDKVAINNGDKVAINIKEKQKESILTFAKNIDNFKTSDIEKLLNIKSSRARLLISEMVKENILNAIGENKNRIYTVKNNDV